MSVHTKITQQEFEKILEHYQVGDLIELKEIAEGITNTIYQLTTTQSDFIFILYETIDAQELEFFTALNKFLTDNNFPVPGLINPTKQQLDFQGKPYHLYQFLDGKSLGKPTAEQSAVIGKTLAQLHLCCRNFKPQRANPFTFSWHKEMATKVMPYLDDKAKALLKSEIQYQAALDYSALPKGIIHMDLFPDNVLFIDNKLSAVLDFNYACTDCYLYDLATTINAWSLSDNQNAKIILDSYDNVRELNHSEREHLKNMRRYSALHFWLKRLEDFHLVKAKDGVTQNDPNVMAALLLLLVAP